VKLALHGNDPLLQNDGIAPLASLLQNLTVLELTAGIDNEGADILSVGLYGNTTLRELAIRQNLNIAETGWQAIFAALQVPHFSLEKLDIGHSKLNDACALALSGALHYNTTLKALDLSDLTWLTSNEGVYTSSITNETWEELFAGILQTPYSVLEYLELQANGLRDDNIISLTSALVGNGR
jgi:hypothetical protein